MLATADALIMQDDLVAERPERDDRRLRQDDLPEERQRCRPSARAASHWPRGTERMAPRKISAW